MLGLTRERDILFNHNKRGKKENKELFVESVKKRKEFNWLVKRAKQNYFKDRFKIYKGDSLKFRDVLYRLLGTKTEIEIGRV